MERNRTAAGRVQSTIISSTGRESLCVLLSLTLSVAGAWFGCCAEVYAFEFD